MRSRRPIRSIVVPIALTGALALGSCVTDRSAAQGEALPEAVPTHESRTGVPILMDIPGIGFLFGRRTVRR